MHSLRVDPPRVLLVLLLLGSSALKGPLPCSAQEAFGSEQQVLWVDALDFRNQNAGDPLELQSAQPFQYYEAPTGGGFVAPLSLPAGARLEGLRCYLYDNANASKIQVMLENPGLYLPDHTSAGGGSISFVAVTGDGGYQERTAVPFTHTVRYQESADVHRIYRLRMFYYAGDRIRGCEIRWRRQVPAPSDDPVFDDVGVGNAQRAYIEALAASGITAGCGAANYCPDAPVTRGQLAVLLAKALGLHWPY